MAKRFSRNDADKVSRAINAQSLIVQHHISLTQLAKGMNIELEHGRKLGKVTNVTNDSAILSARIALAHLIEDRDYYRKLELIESDQ